MPGVLIQVQLAHSEDQYQGHGETAKCVVLVGELHNAAILDFVVRLSHAILIQSEGDFLVMFLQSLLVRLHVWCAEDVMIIA